MEETSERRLERTQNERRAGRKLICKEEKIPEVFMRGKLGNVCKIWINKMINSFSYYYQPFWIFSYLNYLNVLLASISCIFWEDLELDLNLVVKPQTIVTVWNYWCSCWTCSSLFKYSANAGIESMETRETVCANAKRRTCTEKIRLNISVLRVSLFNLLPIRTEMQFKKPVAVIGAPSQTPSLLHSDASTGRSCSSAAAVAL